jgi:hypothetical protein
MVYLNRRDSCFRDYPLYEAKTPKTIRRISPYLLRNIIIVLLVVQYSAD